MTCEPSGRARVLLIDDHQVLAQSLAVALRGEGFETEVADLGDRDRLVESVRQHPPGLAMVDLDIGGAIGDGATLVAPFTQAGARVLVLSAATGTDWVGRAVEQGAIGFVAKSAPFELLIETVIAAARGAEVMSAGERAELLADLHRARESDRHRTAPFDRLTRREQEVLRALGAGQSVRRIARDWYVSEATVRSQVRGVLTKLGVSSQLEAVAQARQTGWLTRD